MSARSKARLQGFAACALAGALWGCSFLFGKIAFREMGFAPMILYRFLFASVALLPLLIRCRPQFTRREWLVLTVASFFGVPMQFLIQFYGLSLTTASHAALMVGTMPVLLAAGAAWFTRERMDATGWAAVAFSTFGAALIATSTGPLHAPGGSSLFGDLLIVLSMLMALAWILLNKQLLERHSPLAVTLYGVLLGTLMLMLWVPLRYGLPPLAHISSSAWLAVLASGLLCTVAPKLLWNWGIARVPASQAGVLLNLQPLVGTLLGILVLRESLGPAAWAGGAIILAATLLLTTRSHTAVAAPAVVPAA